MGGCMSESALKVEKFLGDPHNPIYQIRQRYSIQKLRERWSQQEIQSLQNKLANYHQQPISFESFMALFPKLHRFQPQTQKRVYKLMAYENHGHLTGQELSTALTIIRKVATKKDFAPLLFYVYTQHPTHAYMSKEELKAFQSQNEDYQINLELISEEEDLSDVSLEEAQPTIPPAQSDPNFPPAITSTQQISPSKQKEGQVRRSVLNQGISLERFSFLFEGYNLASYQMLFSWDIGEEELSLVQGMEKEGITRRKGQTVYLMEYKWFLAWRAYAEQKYKVNLVVQAGEEKDGIFAQPSSYSSIPRVRKGSDSPQKEVSSNIRPDRINNQLLAKSANKGYELRPNLVEFVHYICLPEEVWNGLFAIYGGGPTFQRIFPHVYANHVLKVVVNSKGLFLAKSARRIPPTREESRAVSMVGKEEGSTQLLYYKYPGRSDWLLLQDEGTMSDSLFTANRTYVALVGRDVAGKFQQLYNLQEGPKGQVIRERLFNYGLEINVYVKGVLTKAEVVEILDHEEIVIEYTTDNGTSVKQTVKVDHKMKELNPQELHLETFLNQLSGLNNICNTCYINAVLQCLIRTPAFGGYLESEHFKDTASAAKSRPESGAKRRKVSMQKGNEEEEFLLEQIYHIYSQSKSSQYSTIDTRPFKRVFDKNCPFFEGNSQHDAQEFLISLLSRISQEIKSIRKEYGVEEEKLNGDNKQAKPSTSKVNQKVVKFFSGKTKAVTRCRRCRNEGVREEPFFTYSLSMPEMFKMEYSYYMVRRAENVESTVPVRYGLTLTRKTTITEFLGAVAEQQSIGVDRLILYSVFSNELLGKLDGYTHQSEVTHHLNFNTKLVVYEVESRGSPTFYNYQTREYHGRSVKLQLRQRVYSTKTNEYKLMYLPYMLQVTQGMKWSDVEERIHLIMKKLQPQQLVSSNHTANPAKNSSNNGSTLHQSHIMVNTSNGKSNLGFGNNSMMKKDLSHSISNNSHLKKSLPKLYKIHIIKADHRFDNSCFICKEQLELTRRNKTNLVCKGCSFPPDQELFDNKDFRNFNDIVIVVVDWQQTMPDVRQIQNHPSYDQCIKLAQGRFQRLSDLLERNFRLQEEIELTCEREECKFKEAIRTQKIDVTPNILLLHLKRFTYQDNMLVKLSNNVVYQHRIKLPNSQQEYELYGSVIHLGNGVGGHYISYVKVGHKWYRCDDSKVTLAKPGQQIDPNAYILFYRKTNFEPSLMTLSF